jgi:hypothetical protein
MEDRAMSRGRMKAAANVLLAAALILLKRARTDLNS